MKIARWSLLLLVAVSACGPTWSRVPVPPQTPVAAYAAVQVWSHGKATYLADSRITKDAVTGVPANSHGSPVNDCMSEACRVAIALADVDSIRMGSATRTQVLHAAMALGLVVVVLAGVHAR